MENYTVRLEYEDKRELNVRHKVHSYEQAVEFFWNLVMRQRDIDLPHDKWSLTLYSYEDKDVPSERTYLFKFTQLE